MIFNKPLKDCIDKVEYLINGENNQCPSDYVYEIREVIKEAKKQIPTLRIQLLSASENDYYVCPNCREYLSAYHESHCKHCGQAIIWQDNDSWGWDGDEDGE